MGSFDITFCANRYCTSRQICKRNSDRLKDYPWPVSMAELKPDGNGYCGHYMPISCDAYGKACMTCPGCPEEPNDESEVPE